MKIWMAIPVGVTLFLAQGHGVSAQTVQDFSRDCQTDIVRYCPSTVGRPTDMQACLISYREKLEEACKKQFQPRK